MSFHHLFCNNPSIADEPTMPFRLLTDPADRSHIKALRLQVGEHLAVVDASRDYFEVEIESLHDDEIWVRIAQHLDAGRDTNPVMLVQGLAKGEKMDTVLRQATELGITAFHPAKMQRSIVRLDQKRTAKRHERACAIARSAALQSGRLSIPEVERVVPLQRIIDTWSEEDKVLLFWEEAPIEKSISSLFATLHREGRLQDRTRFWVVIGPEGGMTSEEVEAIERSSAEVFTLSLGPTILRTETAGVVACALTLNELRQRCETSLR